MGTALGHEILGVTFQPHNFYKLLEEARSLVLWDSNLLTDQEILIISLIGALIRPVNP